MCFRSLVRVRTRSRRHNWGQFTTPTPERHVPPSSPTSNAPPPSPLKKIMLRVASSTVQHVAATAVQAAVTGAYSVCKDLFAPVAAATASAAATAAATTALAVYKNI